MENTGVILPSSVEDNLPIAEVKHNEDVNQHFTYGDTSEASINVNKNYVNLPQPDVVEELNITRTTEISMPGASSANFFQSSNYFSSTESDFMPVGSEILFGKGDQVSACETSSIGTNV